MTTQEFIDAIKGMTVLELNDLVKACEEEFGVSAAAGVVVAAAAGGEAAAEKDEDAVKAIAEAKGLSVVLNKDTVVYGGTDITQDVIKKLSK